jgi:Co/Zn/Cd efflux system component
LDQTQAEIRALRVALLLNGAMFVIGTAAGLLADSIGLLADALDMFADAGAYGLSLAAIGRSGLFKARVAGASGAILFVLGGGVLLDAVRRAGSLYWCPWCRSWSMPM